jgi:cytochrome d ubiquinol oxidase subunit I
LTASAVLLARAQFAFTMAFHIVFPAVSIGLASFLAVLEGLWLATGRDTYLNLFRYWLKIFSVVFGMGVVSGLVMSYQFGSNWSNFADRAGPIIGPLMAYEVLTAFFLEAGFLGIMLFGLTRVGRALHYSATLAVAAGTLASAFWILAANSWMQTPAGFITGPTGQLLPESWVAIIFNPSFPYRLVHMVLAAYLSTSLVVGGVAAWHLLRGQDTPEVRRMYSMALWMAALVAPVQIIAGDMHGLNTLEHQPAKIMAIEGHFDSSRGGAPLVLFGIPDQQAARVRGAIEIPELSSLVLKHDLHAPLAGLDTIPREDWPPVAIIFWTFRVMVGLGMAILGLGVFSLVARWRSVLFTNRSLQRLALLLAPAGIAAVIAGWFTTEIGRQPFTIYGVLRTTEAASPLATPAVAASLAAFAVVYFTVFGAGACYILRLMGAPPRAGESPPETQPPQRSAGIVPQGLI